MERHIAVPLTSEEAETLHAGDYVYLTGTIYTARDAAHKRMYEALEKGEQLPLELKDNVIYYMGPSPAREGRAIGSAGPPIVLPRTENFFTPCPAVLLSPLSQDKTQGKK